jgi:hypothetical protein
VPPLMRSELPVVARTRHHWIVLMRLPSLVPGLLLLGLILWGLLYPAMAIVAVLVLAAALWFRWQTWRAEQLILTRQRLIRVQGVPETTTTEAFLRVDRISGMRIVQSVPGKLLDYATIELEASGSHPDVRHMVKIWHPHQFYKALRQLIFDEPRPDPDDTGTPTPDNVTERLPRLDK